MPDMRDRPVALLLATVVVVVLFGTVPVALMTGWFHG